MSQEWEPQPRPAEPLGADLDLVSRMIGRAWAVRLPTLLALVCLVAAAAYLARMFQQFPHGGRLTIVYLALAIATIAHAGAQFACVALGERPKLVTTAQQDHRVIRAATTSVALGIMWLAIAAAFSLIP